MTGFTNDSEIDSSVSFLIGELLLAGFVFLSIIGMNVLEQDAETAGRDLETEPTPIVEIGQE